MSADSTEIWEGWDDPLSEIATFIKSSPPRAVAEQLYQLVLREIVTEYLLENGLNPLDRELARSVYSTEVAHFTKLANERLLQICASIASREG